MYINFSGREMIIDYRAQETLIFRSPRVERRLTVVQLWPAQGLHSGKVYPHERFKKVDERCFYWRVAERVADRVANRVFNRVMPHAQAPEKQSTDRFGSR